MDPESVLVEPKYTICESTRSLDFWEKSYCEMREDIQKKLTNFRTDNILIDSKSLVKLRSILKHDIELCRTSNLPSYFLRISTTDVLKKWKLDLNSGGLFILIYQQ